MKTSDFSYDLPEELIAQDPAERRDLSRLLVINKNTGKREHKDFNDIIAYLVPGDCLVVNNTKVIPARLLGEREGTGGKVEVLLLKRKENDIWETLVRPGKKARPGQKLEFGGGLLKAEVLETAEDGNRLVQFNYDGIFEEILDKLGQLPLPPYIPQAWSGTGCNESATSRLPRPPLQAAPPHRRSCVYILSPSAVSPALRTYLRI